MAAPVAFSGVSRQLRIVVVVNVRSILCGSIAPAAEPDHLVVLDPLRERIVGRMHNDKASTVGHKFLKSLFGRFLPRLAVVIRNDDIELGKVWREVFINAFGGRASQINREQSGFQQITTHHLSRLWPDSVVVLSRPRSRL